MNDTPGIISRPIWPVTVMTVMSAASLGICSNSYVALAVICGLLLIHLMTGLPRLPRPRTFFAAMLMVPFGLWVRYGTERIMLLNLEVPIGFLAVVGFYMLALATHHILAHRNGGSRDYAMACAVMGMGIAGSFKPSDNPIYIPTLLVFCAMLLWYIRRENVERARESRGGESQRSAWLAYAVSLMLLVFLTYNVDLLFVQQIPRMSSWALRTISPNFGRPTEIGFTRRSHLTSITNFWGQKTGRSADVMLDVFGSDPGEYFRGGIYQSYANGAWNIVDERQVLQPEGSEGGRNIFNMLNIPATQVKAIVYPARDVNTTVFMPLGTHQVGSFTDRLLYSPLQSMKPKEDNLAGGYLVYDVVGRSPPPTEADLDVPVELRRTLRSILRNIVPQNSTPREAAEKLKEHFSTHFRYSWGINLQPGSDPVLQFLQHIHHGHCEYFATAGCLLLRSHGVPARYATGFVVSEKGLGGDNWVARRRDAHAWVEAYLPPKGWTVVEMTPPSEMPQSAGHRAEGFERWTMWLRAQWHRLTSLAFYGGLSALVTGLLDFIASIPQRLPIWAWVLLALAGVAWVMRKDLREWRRRRGEVVDADVRQLQAQLREAERMLRRHGLVRRSSMTVAHYLEMVDSAVALPPTVRRQALEMLGDYLRRRFRAAATADSGVPPRASSQ